VIGVVLAGGASTRFGGKPKGLATIAGRAMALRAVDVLQEVCARVVIEAPPGAGYEALGLSILHAPTEHAGKGPLAGIAAALGQAPMGELAAFAPCDMPLLTPAVYEALKNAAAGAPGAYARTPAGVEPLVAVLSAGIRTMLLSVLALDTLPRAHIALDAAGARALDFGDETPFANVNTPADLACLEARFGA
jgi:molybdopterin-guanine dinucleotide biosynthesis protein A